MPRRVFNADTTIAANNAVTVLGPRFSQLSIPPFILTHVRIVIPDGHNHLTSVGFFIDTDQVFPEPPTAPFAGNDETIDWDVENAPVTDHWRIGCTNQDANFDHTFYIRLFGEPVEAPAAGPPPFLPANVSL